MKLIIKKTIETGVGEGGRRIAEERGGNMCTEVN